jgi:outer membrane protein assembly factor BamB
MKRMENAVSGLNWKYMSGLAAAGLISAAALLSSAALAQPTVIVSPAAGPPTENITVGGSGFAASEGVQVSFDTTELGFGAANQAGSFSGIRLNVPASAFPGTHFISAVGTLSGATAHAGFIVRTNWPQFHFGPPLLGYNAFENVLTAANVGAMQIRWKAHTGAIAYSSPVVANGIVYAASMDNSLYAFDAATGSLVWSVVTGGPIDSSPAVTNGVVYVASGDYYLYAFNSATGQLIWQTLLGGVGSSPTVLNGVIYVESYVPSNGGDNSLHAVDGATGQLIWSQSLGFEPSAPRVPAVANGIIYFTFDNQWLWDFELSGPGILAKVMGCTSSPAVASGVVYVGDGDSLSAIDASSFGVIWGAGTSGTITSSPAVANGVVYVGSSDQHLYAFNTLTGVQVWSASTSGPVASSPAVANGVVYVGSNDHSIYAFDAVTGTQLWVGATGGPVTSSPAVVNGVVYVGSEDGYLYAFSQP